VKLDNPIQAPRVLSFLTHRRWTSRIEGLTSFSPADWPDNVPLLYYAYHMMVGLGTIFMAIMAGAAFFLWRRRLHRTRPVLWVLMLSLPLPFIANTAGWMTAELGRQPWIVHGEPVEDHILGGGRGDPVTRNDDERETVLASIRPAWDGNEVWLVAAGGTMFFAFPRLLGTAFSGFYLPLMFVLWLLVFRALALRAPRPRPRAGTHRARGRRGGGRAGHGAGVVDPGDPPRARLLRVPVHAAPAEDRRPRRVVISGAWP